MKGYSCLIKKKKNQNFKFFILEAKQMYTTKCQVRARRSHKDFPNNLTKCECHICHPGLRTQEAPHQCQVRLVAQWGQGHQQEPWSETITLSHTQTISKHNTKHNGKPVGHREKNKQSTQLFPDHRGALCTRRAKKAGVAHCNLRI